MVGVIIFLLVIGSTLAAYLNYVFDVLYYKLEAQKQVLAWMYAEVQELKRTEKALNIAETALAEKEEELEKLKVENDFYKGMLFK